MADTSTVALVLRLALSLGLILALVGGFTWMLRRKGLLRPGAAGGRGGRLEVLDRRALNKHASIVLARVGGTAVLLGVTEQRVQVLSSAEGLDAAWDDIAELDTTSTPDTVPTVASTAAATNTAEITTMPQVPAHPPIGPVPVPVPVAAATSGTAVLGARRTGLPVATTATPPARMSIVEALRELTVRRS